MRPTDKEIVARVLKSLQEHPEQWGTDHRRGIKHHISDTFIGLSSGRWGLYILVEVRIDNNTPLQFHDIGGVHLFPFIGCLIPWRRKIYRAALPIFDRITKARLSEAAMKVVRNAT
jgi:hypothetical protein